MPKALKAHPGERLDLPDYVLGANTYTQDTQKFFIERELTDRRARILDGFRIRVEDQTANPGLITIFNGNAVDRDGRLINNEEVPNDARSITLTGSNLNFYVEIEFAEVVSDTDARYFWDPTIPNPPDPNGSEFTLNVATRITPDWRVVTPVSTTGFQQSSNPNSIRVPVGVFRTDASNQITGGANPGLTLVTAASVLEADTAIGTVNLRVVDARIFPATTPFNVTVDVGSAVPEARTVTSVDRINGILTLSVATASTHQAGAIVRVTSGTANIYRERTDPSDPTLDPLLATPGHPDPAQRMWQANELRGSGLLQSKETFGARDDLNLRSLKDQIDYLSAQLREMKFGHPRPDIVSSAPPSAFSARPRYFDRAGSIQGAKTNTVSIGNGSTTFGDFNGTTEAAFIAAINALPAGGGTVFVKGGTYTFASTVVVGKQVTFVGEGYNVVNIANNAAAGPAFSVTVSCAFRNMTISKAAGGLAAAIDVAGSVTTTIEYCVITTSVRINGAVTGAIRASRTSFSPSTAVACVSSLGGGTLSLSSFNDCSFVSSLVAFSCPMNGVALNDCFIFSGIGFLAGGVSDVIQSLNVSRCNITVASSVFASTSTQVITEVCFSRCYITATSLAVNGAVFLFSSTGNLSNFAVADSYIQVTGVGALTEANPGSIVSANAAGTVSNLRVERNDIEVPTGTYVIGLSSDGLSTPKPIRFTGNNCFRLAEMVRIGSSANNMISGDYMITDNFDNNGGSSAVAYGLRLFSTPTASHIQLTRNYFTNFNNVGAGVRVGVDATWDTLQCVDITIENNIFWLFTGTQASGVLFSSIATAPSAGSVRVKNNKFRDIQGTGTYSAGVYFNPSAATGIEFEVVGNSIVGTGLAGASTSAYGVYFSGVSRGSVSSNQIVQTATNNASGEGVSILLNGCQNVVVGHNRLFRAASASGAAVNLYGALIKLRGQQSSILVNNNICSQAGETGALASGHIVLISDSCAGIQLIGNRIVSSSTGGIHGIIITRDTTTAASIAGVQVQNNSIEMNASIAWAGISAYLGGNSSGLSISDNLIRETTLAAGHSGILVEGHNNPVQTRGVAVCSNTLVGAKTGSVSAGRPAILIRDCRVVSVLNNLVDWMEPSLATGSSIELLSTLAGTWRQFNVVGNIVRPSGGASNYELNILTANIQDGQAHSNSFGDSVTAGAINPAVAAGGWTYGAAALTNFNKLT
ncbi:MAG: hypothetical protein EBS53_00090 [Bacteroidetes bacterium]|nr:hypothetical protein [Bacteroidota bacterium]